MVESRVWASLESPRECSKVYRSGRLYGLLVHLVTTGTVAQHPEHHPECIDDGVRPMLGRGRSRLVRVRVRAGQGEGSVRVRVRMGAKVRVEGER